MLTRAISDEGIEPVARRHSQILKPIRKVDVVEFAQGTPDDVGRQSSRATIGEKQLSFAIGERLDHW